MTINLGKRSTFGSRFGEAVGAGIASGAEAGLNERSARKLKKESDSAEEAKRVKTAQIVSDLTGMDVSELPLDQLKGVMDQFTKQEFKTRGKKDILSGLGFSDYIDEGSRQQQPQSKEFTDQVNPSGENDLGKVDVGAKGKEIPEDMIFNAEIAGEHGLAQQLRAHNDKIFQEKKANRKIFEGDRKYHTEFSKKADEEAEGMRRSIPKKESSLNFARDAIEQGDPSYFSLDKLADITGSDLFRTAKGAQLITASKENLLANMSRVSGKAQNMWFEQRLNSMFPKIGQSKEANLTVQEMLEGEVALDKAYLNEYDKISERDLQDYGYVQKDIAKRAHNAIKPLEKEIMQRTTYRMKEIEEQEKGLKSLNSKVGKNVSKGTPMTLAMMALYVDKFGDNAIKVAEKNGYHIPTYEEWQRYNNGNLNE